jgi:hypothetical protein
LKLPGLARVRRNALAQPLLRHNSRSQQVHQVLKGFEAEHNTGHAV